MIGLGSPIAVQLTLQPSSNLINYQLKRRIEPMKTIANVLPIAASSFHTASHGEADPDYPAINYTAAMLRRTTPPQDGPDRVDYVVVERIARDLRNQYIASLIGRAKKALVARLARRDAPGILSR